MTAGWIRLFDMSLWNAVKAEQQVVVFRFQIIRCAGHQSRDVIWIIIVWRLHRDLHAGCESLSDFLKAAFSAIGRLIEVNLLTSETSARKILKVPRCPACSSLNLRSPTGLTAPFEKLRQNAS